MACARQFTRSAALLGPAPASCAILAEQNMLQLPVLRWGQPYTSMDVDDVVHFQTGEPIARVSRANGGLIQRDMRRAQRARAALRRIQIDVLIASVGQGGADV